jgi:hypothetical protein
MVVYMISTFYRMCTIRYLCMHYVCCHCGKGISQTRPKPIPVVVHMSQCCQYTCAKHTCNSHIQYSYFDMYGYLGKQGTTQSTVVLSAHVNISVCKLPPYMWMHVHNYIKDTWKMKHAIHTCMHACMHVITYTPIAYRTTAGSSCCCFCCCRCCCCC